MGMRILGLHGGFDRAAVRPMQKIVPDLDGGRLIAEPDAGRAHDAHRRPQRALQVGEQLLRAQKRASETIADADRHPRKIGLALLHDVEMRVESRRLEHLGEGELHDLGERREMAGRDLAKAVLDQVEMLDEEVAAKRPVAEQRLDLGERLWINLPSLRGGLGALSPGAGVFEVAHLDGVVIVHCSSAAVRRSSKFTHSSVRARRDAALRTAASFAKAVSRIRLIVG